MRYLATSSLPVMLFGGAVLLVYYLYARLWLGWLIRKLRKKDTRKRLTGRGAVCLHVIAGIGLLCMAYGYFVEPYRLQVNTVTIETDKLNRTSFRIVQISDLHCDGKIRLENRLAERVNTLKPDAIVFTGDAVNTEAALGRFQNTLKQMDAPLGKYAVTGNWDYSFWSGLDLFENTGFDELRTHTRRLEKDGEFIVLGGLAFKNGRHSQRVIEQLQPEDFNILLYHNSDLMDYLAGKPVDLYLSGHTHGGQVALPFYGALTTLSKHGKKFEAGLYRQGGMLLYVNRGIGLEGGHSPKVRFWARPEITVVEIRPKAAGMIQN